MKWLCFSLCVRHICSYVVHLFFKDMMLLLQAPTTAQAFTGTKDLADLMTFKISISLLQGLNVIKNILQVNLFLEFIMKNTQ